jgi:hypothetical protein
MSTSYNKVFKGIGRFLFDFLLDDYLGWKILTRHFVPRKNTVSFLKASLSSLPSTKNPLLGKVLTNGLKVKK